MQGSGHANKPLSAVGLFHPGLYIWVHTFLALMRFTVMKSEPAAQSRWIHGSPLKISRRSRLKPCPPVTPAIQLSLCEGLQLRYAASSHFAWVMEGGCGNGGDQCTSKAIEWHLGSVHPLSGPFVTSMGAYPLAKSSAALWWHGSHAGRGRSLFKKGC